MHTCVCACACIRTHTQTDCMWDYKGKWWHFFHDGSAYVENPFIYSEIIVTVIATIAHYFSYFSMICFILEETKE